MAPYDDWAKERSMQDYLIHRPKIQEAIMSLLEKGSAKKRTIINTLSHFDASQVIEALRELKQGGKVKIKPARLAKEAPRELDETYLL